MKKVNEKIESKIKKIFFVLLILCLCIIPIFFISCKTVDFEKTQLPEIETESKENFEQTEIDIATQQDKKQLVEELTATVDMEKQIVVIKTPQYIPVQEEPPEIKKGVEAAYEMTQNIKEPDNYEYSAMINDYIQNQVYMAYTQQGLVTDIYLEPGETLIGTPAISDNRFTLGTTFHMENGLQVQHVLVKPSIAGLTGTLTIYTNKRVYPLILKSYVNVYTPIVRWIYKDNGMPWTLFNENQNSISLGNTIEYVNPEFLSFNYKMSYFKKPSWLPKNVYDDGKKTYIVLPEIVLQREYPVIFENEYDLVNYRVSGTVIIIDKLIEKITLRTDKEKVTIYKKKG